MTVGTFLLQNILFMVYSNQKSLFLFYHQFVFVYHRNYTSQFCMFFTLNTLWLMLLKLVFSFITGTLFMSLAPFSKSPKVNLGAEFLLTVISFILLNLSCLNFLSNCSNFLCFFQSFYPSSFLSLNNFSVSSCW